MEAKQYIRTYEQLKNEKNIETVQKQLELERKWLNFYKEMDFVIRKMTKKQKVQLEPFKEKTLNELKKVSSQVFLRLTNKKENEFNRLFQNETSLFFKKGTAGLLHLVDVNVQEAINQVKQKEETLSKTEEEWCKQAQTVLVMPYDTLEEAYQLEAQLVHLFQWWDSKAKRTNQVNKLHPLYASLCRSHADLLNFLLQVYGYSFEYTDVFKQKRQKNMLRLHGFVKTLQLLEKEEGFLTPFMQALQPEIAFIHPKEEFRHVRHYKRHFVLHIGPTNSGKTYQAIEALKQAPSGIYLAPIRLLALEIQEKLLAQGVPCSLRTGEEEIHLPQAKHQASTIEITNFKDELDVAVIDEVQMLEEPVRGAAWLRAIFGVKAKEIHLCGAPHSLEFVKNLIDECGDTYEIHHYERQTDLLVEEETFSFPHDVRKGDALIVFSKKKVLEAAHELKRAGYRVSIMYGKLPSETRKKQVEFFASGEHDVIVTTDAIGIGLNLPIERIVFLETKKFDGKEARLLTTQEVKQIAGRAGRKGLYEKGYVNALADKSYIAEKLQETEEDIKKSILAPTIKLAKLNMGTLRHRFLAWRETELHADYLEKADIERQLTLLQHVEQWEHVIGATQLFKSLYVSFDLENRQLLFTWMNYVRTLKEGKNALEKPKLTGKTGVHLENYYHQLNLYQQFSKKFNLPYASAWVKEEKTKTAQWINQQIRGVSHRYVR